MVGMLDSLSLKNTKLGLETLDLMGYDDRQRLARPQPRRLARRHHRPTTSSTIIGRAPDVLVPSDREIPRSVNEGTPIVAVEAGVRRGEGVPAASPTATRRRRRADAGAAAAARSPASCAR